MYYTDERSGEICEEDIGQAWACYEDENIDFSIYSVTTRPSEDWNKEVVTINGQVKSGDEVYIVVARYFDGGTFGRTCGYFSFQFATKSYEKAEAFQESINRGDSPEYKPWVGYFSGLEDVEIWRVVVDKNSAHRV